MKILQRLLASILPPRPNSSMPDIETEHEQREELRKEIAATSAAATNVAEQTKRIAKDRDRFATLVGNMRRS